MDRLQDAPYSLVSGDLVRFRVSATDAAGTGEVSPAFCSIEVPFAQCTDGPMPEFQELLFAYDRAIDAERVRLDAAIAGYEAE